MNNNQMNRQIIDGDRVRVRMRVEVMINQMSERMLNEKLAHRKITRFGNGEFSRNCQ